VRSNRQLLIVFLFLGYAFAKAQSPTSNTETPIIAADSIAQKEAYDPLRPARAAFYAAALPGLGQVYNKDYWKLPLVYGALGTGVFVAVDSDREFQRFRTAFKDRLAGRRDEFTQEDPNNPGEFIEVFSDDALIRGQDLFRRRKELAILVTAGMYVLQIIEANVDAHLTQYDVDDDLTFAPDIHTDDMGLAMHYGFKLTYKID
jgi:hypothetical protein